MIETVYRDRLAGAKDPASYRRLAEMLAGEAEATELFTKKFLPPMEGFVSRFNKPLTSLFRYVLPFLLIMALSVLLITYVPDLSLGLLKLLGRV